MSMTTFNEEKEVKSKGPKNNEKQIGKKIKQPIF
jgi:hypothetical protein